MCATVTACGGKADSSGGTTTTHTGGSLATSTLASVGGGAVSGGLSSVLVTGGTTAKASGTYATTSGGVSSTHPLTTVGPAGASSTGGTKANTGGASSTLTGGTGSFDHSSASSSVGGVTNTGGRTSTAGTTATGGSSQLGGTTSVGGTTSNGGTSALFTSFLDAGLALDDFCTGNDSKVSYQGQVMQAPATSYQSSLVMDCCQTYGINLHTKPTLDFDLDIETLWSGTDPGANPFVVGSSYQPMRALVHGSTDSATATVRADGSGALLTPLSFRDPFDLALCLLLQATETTLYGTLIYIPNVTISSVSSGGRFQVFLLNDSTMTTTQAAAQPLDSLTLAQNPLLDLSKITYLSSSTHELGFNPGQKIGEAVQTQLGSSMAFPFVVEADGARVFLGTFVSAVSSVAYPLPSITIQSIQTDTMTFYIPSGSTDPLADARVTTVFTSLGKLIP